MWLQYNIRDVKAFWIMAANASPAGQADYLTTLVPRKFKPKDGKSKDDTTNTSLNICTITQLTSPELS
jgi:hypothetical protein